MARSLTPKKIKELDASLVKRDEEKPEMKILALENQLEVKEIELMDAMEKQNIILFDIDNSISKRRLEISKKSWRKQIKAHKKSLESIKEKLAEARNEEKEK